MIKQDRQTEWPLVVFTLGTQLATGLAIAATLCDRMPQIATPARWLGVAVAPIAFIATAASLAHLGRPWAGWRALLNIRTSPLSREVLASAAFLVVALGYSLSFFSDVSQARVMLGTAVAILGLATVVLSSLVYLIPTQPAWNSWTVPLSFVSTAVLSGGIAARLALGNSQTSAAHRAVYAVIAASVVLVLCALAAATRRAKLHGLRFTSNASTYAYCAVLSITALWAAAEPAADGTGWPIEAGILILLVAFVAVQRATMYRQDRLPQF